MTSGVAPRATAAQRRAAPPRVLVVKRPLVLPSGDPRRLLALVRRLDVRRAVLLGVVLVALTMLHVWSRLQVRQLGYELAAARQMEKRLLHEQKELGVELEMLRAKTRLVDEARRRLGMGDARRGQLVELP